MSQRLEAHALNPTIAKCSKCNMPNDVIAGLQPHFPISVESNETSYYI